MRRLQDPRMAAVKRVDAGRQAVGYGSRAAAGADAGRWSSFRAKRCAAPRARLRGEILDRGYCGPSGAKLQSLIDRGLIAAETETVSDDDERLSVGGVPPGL